MNRNENEPQKPAFVKPLLCAAPSTKPPGDLKDYWVVVSAKGNVDYFTIASSRKESIRRCLDGGTMTWKQTKEYGWRVVKVDIVFKPK